MNKENLGSPDFKESPKSKPFNSAINKAIEISDSIDQLDSTIAEDAPTTPSETDQSSVKEAKNTAEKLPDSDLERRLKIIDEFGLSTYESVRQKLIDEFNTLHNQSESMANQAQLFDSEISAMNAAIEAYKKSKEPTSKEYPNLSGPYFSSHTENSYSYNINADGTISSAKTPEERAQETRDYLDRIGH